MTIKLRLICTFTLGVALTVHAQAPALVPLETATFIDSSSRCSVFVGGPDHANDRADKQYGKSLYAALAAMDGPLPLNVESIRVACVKRLTSPDVFPKEAS